MKLHSRRHSSDAQVKYGEYSPYGRGLIDSSNFDQWENLEAKPSNSVIGKKFESFQQKTDFEDPNRASVTPSSNALASSTKLNPNANPFIPNPIQWEKLPLAPVNPSLSLSPSFDLDLNERSFRSPIDEAASLISNDVMFKQPYAIRRAFSFPEYESRNKHQICGVDRHIFHRDSAIVDNSDISNQKTNWRRSPAELGKTDIAGKTWNCSPTLCWQQTLENERLFDPIRRDVSTRQPKCIRYQS